MRENTTPESEELIEKELCRVIAESATIPVEGALIPASSGTAKNIDADTFVSVLVDQMSQDLDYAGNGAIHTYAVRVTVRYAMADDKSGSDFRDECRRVRAALVNLTGEGCTALSTSGAFSCDGFILNSTSTSFDGGDNPLNAKTYSATLHGRNLTITAA